VSLELAISVMKVNGLIITLLRSPPFRLAAASNSAQAWQAD
jgi:hypothetical protein